MNTLAANLNQVLGESGFLIPDSYIGNADQNIVQIVALAQAVALEYIEEEWQLLRKTFSQVLSAATSYALPTDYRAFAPDTMYQHGRWDAVDLPTTDEIWGLLSSVNGLSSLPIRARISAGTFNILNPQSGATITADYYSNAPITGASAAQSQFLLDTDTWLLDDRLFQLETKWRFKREKGLEWQSGKAEADNRRYQVRARDKGAGVIVPRQQSVTSQPYANLWVT